MEKMKRKAVEGLIAIIAIAVVVLFVGCVDKEEPGPTPQPTTPTYTPKPTVTPTPSLTETPAKSEGNTHEDNKNDFDSLQYSHYLPLAKGNTWTYKKTIQGNREVFCWSLYDADRFIYGPLELTTGISEETYAVEKSFVENGRKSWGIHVSGSEARDGRYGAMRGFIDKIIWRRVPSSEHVIEIDEIIVRHSSFLGEWMQESPIVIEPIRKELKVSAMSGWWDNTTFHPYPIDIETTSQLEKVKITVPAGTWNEFLKICTEVNTDDYQWVTCSYYARDVGLVKEIQKDRNGDLTYSLELVRYTLKQE